MLGDSVEVVFIEENSDSKTCKGKTMDSTLGHFTIWNFREHVAILENTERTKSDFSRLFDNDFKAKSKFQTLVSSLIQIFSYTTKFLICRRLIETQWNDFVLPAMFIMVDNIHQHPHTFSGSTILFHIVDIVQSCFYQPWTRGIILAYTTWLIILLKLFLD